MADRTRDTGQEPDRCRLCDHRLDEHQMTSRAVRCRGCEGGVCDDTSRERNRATNPAPGRRVIPASEGDK